MSYELRTYQQQKNLEENIKQYRMKYKYYIKYDTDILE